MSGRLENDSFILKYNRDVVRNVGFTAGMKENRLKKQWRKWRKGMKGDIMIYTVKRIDEDVDYGCEERPEDAPVMAVVTLTNPLGEELVIKAEDAMLYECNINEGDKVSIDENNKLEKSYEEGQNEKSYDFIPGNRVSL